MTGVGAVEWDTVFVGLAATASAGALLVSLYGWRLRRPVLSLLPFSDGPPDGAVVYNERGDVSAWLRLRVANKGGRLPAIGTEVTIVDIERMSDRRSTALEELERSRAPRLVADHERLLIGYPLKWADRPRFQLNITGGTERLIDLVYLPSPPDRRHLRFPIWEEEDWWELRDQPQRRRHRPDERHCVYWPTYKLGLSLTCADSRPVYYQLEVRWDETWPQNDAEIWRHLRVVIHNRTHRWPPPGLSHGHHFAP